MLTSLDNGSKMHGTKARRCRQYHQIHPAINEFLISVETDELVRHIHFFLMPLLETIHGTLYLSLIHI